MNIVSKLTPLTRFKLEGSIRGFLSTIPGSIVFAFFIITAFSIKNGYKELVSDDFPLFDTVGLFIFIGLLFSFIPATFGGWQLASQIYKNADKITVKSGIVMGAIIGGASMFGFEFVLGILSLTTPHGLSMDILLIYIFSSIMIAIVFGAWVGLQLTRKILKNKSSNEQH